MLRFLFKKIAVKQKTKSIGMIKKLQNVYVNYMWGVHTRFTIF